MTVPVIMIVCCFQKLDAVGVDQIDDDCVARQAFNRLVQREFHVLADPYDDIGIAQLASLGWPQTAMVSGLTWRHHHGRFSNALHDAGDNGVDRGDAGGNIGHIGRSCCGEHGGGQKRCGHESTDVHGGLQALGGNINRYVIT